MLDYFVKIFPGEAPYSYLMRLKYNLGLNDKDFARQILNRSEINQQIIIGSIDFQHFKNTFKSLQTVSMKKWLRKFTLLPFGKNFIDIYSYDWDALQNRKYTKKVQYFVQHRGKPTIKFCKSCYLENKNFYNNYFLLKKHQLPTVYICSKHAEPLHYINIFKKSNAIHSLEISKLLFHKELKQFELSEKQSFIQLAKNANDLLNFPIESSNIRDHFLRLYQLVNSKSSDFDSLSFDLQLYYGKFLDELMLLNRDLPFKEINLKTEFLPYKNFYAPVICMLVYQLNKIYYKNSLISPILDQGIVASRRVCINKICENYRKAKSELLKKTLSRSNTAIGIYKCPECQMVYYQKYSTSGTIGSPYILNYGHPFISKLQQLVKDNIWPKRLSYILGVDENEILKLVTLLNITPHILIGYIHENFQTIGFKDEIEELYFSEPNNSTHHYQRYRNTAFKYVPKDTVEIYDKNSNLIFRMKTSKTAKNIS